MRSAPGVLPASVAAPRASARAWLALAAGIGAGVLAYAGLYPQFDEGKLRMIVALTSAPFGAAVVAASVGARTGGRAFGRAVGLSALLGMAVTVIPAAILTRNHSNEFVLACFFGAFFGAITGASYGIPLGVLSALGQPHVKAETHDGVDRAARSGGLWLLAVAAIGLALTGLEGLRKDRADLDHGLQERDPAMGLSLTDAAPSPMPAIVASLAGLAALVVALRGSARSRRRAAWIGRVRSGLEPAFRVRAAEPRDSLQGLPRLITASTTVIEWLPAETPETSAQSAYRMPAAGTAIAVV